MPTTDKSLASRIAADLVVPVGTVHAIASSASHQYKRYTIAKRAGGRRIIDHPSRRLKAIQRWLLHHMIQHWPVHDAAYAYRKGYNIRAHALRHVNSHFLLRMDFADFFPSLSSIDLASYLEQRPPGTRGWNDGDRILFCQLVTRYAKLTVGSPSSPALSNALCFTLDSRLTEKARLFRVTYTRYADDLFFSSREPDILRGLVAEVEREVELLDLPGSLKINPLKTRHSSKRGERRVTGIVLSPNETISPGRSRKRRVRSMLFKLRSLSPDERRKLAGELAYLFSIQPDFENVLILKFGRQRVEAAIRPMTDEEQSGDH